MTFILAPRMELGISIEIHHKHILNLFYSELFDENRSTGPYS